MLEPSIYGLWAGKQTARGTKNAAPGKRLVQVGGDFNTARDDGEENYSDLTKYGARTDWINSVTAIGEPACRVHTDRARLSPLALSTAPRPSRPSPARRRHRSTHSRRRPAAVFGATFVKRVGLTQVMRHSFNDSLIGRITIEGSTVGQGRPHHAAHPQPRPRRGHRGGPRGDHAGGQVAPLHRRHRHVHHRRRRHPGTVAIHARHRRRPQRHLRRRRPRARRRAGQRRRHHRRHAHHGRARARRVQQDRLRHRGARRRHQAAQDRPGARLLPVRPQAARQRRRAQRPRVQGQYPRRQVGSPRRARAGARWRHHRARARRRHAARSADSRRTPSTSTPPTPTSRSRRRHGKENTR
jgi:hypothetical protein